jgi:SPP1 gp7 family putative phage head morphogenesis protein
VAITNETMRLQQQLRLEVNQITDAQVRDLVTAWATAWSEVSLDLELALHHLLAAADGQCITRAMVMRTERLTRSLLVVQNRLERLTGDAGIRITADLDEIVRRADTAQAGIVASQLPSGERALIDAWSSVDGRQLQAIVRRSTQQITSRMRPLSREATAAVGRELVRGVAAGSNPNEMAARMLQRVEGRFLGGLPRATAIARTETLDAHRQASRESRITNRDVLAGWSWHCELSTRSCPACISMDGTVFPVDAAGPDDHVNGRCSAVPITRSWADLGISDMVEPPSALVPAVDRFAAMPEADQRSILGPARYEAWRAGDYPPSAWAQRRVNDGWRDSVQVSPAPQSGGRRSSAVAS